MIEGQQQARLLKAQILLLCNQTEEARRLAEEVLPIAQAMQYEIVATHAQNILTGQTPLQAVQEWRERRSGQRFFHDLRNR
jgi:hypothetical protein